VSSSPPIALPSLRISEEGVRELLTRTSAPPTVSTFQTSLASIFANRSFLEITAISYAPTYSSTSLTLFRLHQISHSRFFLGVASFLPQSQAGQSTAIRSIPTVLWRMDLGFFSVPSKSNAVGTKTIPKEGVEFHSSEYGLLGLLEQPREETDP